MLTTAFGVFGGTFTPIHFGHLRLALELRERLKLSKVFMVPSARPPHRDAPSISPERRLEWVTQACAGEASLIVDDRELRRDGPSYMVDTLADFRAEHRDAPIVLMLGDDAANQLHTWNRWRELFDYAHLVFVERPYEPPAPVPELAAFLRGRRAATADDLLMRTAGSWMAIAIPPLAISSTRIRRLLAAGRSIRGLVPESVIHSLSHKDIQALTHDEDPAYD